LSLAAASSIVIRECAPLSLVKEKVMRMEVLAKEIRRDLAAIRVKASKGVLHMVVHVGDVVVGLRSSRKLKACDKLSNL
jgi:hypothetical protein